MPRVVLLFGPPSPSSAERWTDSELCVDTFLPAYEVFSPESTCVQDGNAHSREEHGCSKRNEKQPDDSVQRPPQWRLLNHPQLHLPTGLSQVDWVRSPYVETVEESGRLSVSNALSNKRKRFTIDNVDDQFISGDEVDLPENRPVGNSKESRSVSSQDDSPSTSSLEDSFSSFKSGNDQQRPLYRSVTDARMTEGVHYGAAIGPITDLRCLPNAGHVNRSYPQTLTVNLVVTVLAVGPLQEVILRRTGQPATVAECRVADETEEQFMIKLWSRPKMFESDVSKSSREAGLPDLFVAMNSLLAGEVVILRHIALSSWRGVVYGQSLSVRRQTRDQPRPHWETLTTLSRVRTETDGTIRGFSEAVENKIERVVRWSRTYVANEYLKTPVRQRIMVSNNNMATPKAPSASHGSKDEGNDLTLAFDRAGSNILPPKNKKVEKSLLDEAWRNKVVELPIDDTPR